MQQSTVLSTWELFALWLNSFKIEFIFCLGNEFREGGSLPLGWEKSRHLYECLRAENGAGSRDCLCHNSGFFI